MVFLVVYYVNVARLDPYDVGVVLLVLRIWSAACDLIAGRLVDRRSSARGRFRPYLLWATPPLLLAGTGRATGPAARTCRSRCTP